MRYKPQEPPTDTKNLPQYLSGELRRLEAVISHPVLAESTATATFSIPAGGHTIVGQYINADGELVVVYT